MKPIISEKAKRKNLIYQLYPAVDGTLPEMSRLVEHHIKKIKPDYIWLCPIYQSPWVDGGYDVSDYCQIDERFGTLEDFDTFVTTCKRHGIKVMMDLPLNHTSTEHRWFQRSAEWKKLDFYYLPEMHRPKHYYLWTKRPVNWQSLFGGDACEYHEGRGEYYLHLFDKTQADLNWRNPYMVEEFQKIIDFWTEHGVKGFRLDMCNVLVKSEMTAEMRKARQLEKLYKKITGDTHFRIANDWKDDWTNQPDFDMKVLLKNDWAPIFRGCTKYYQRPETIEILRKLFSERNLFTMGEAAGGVLFSRKKLHELTTNAIDVAYNSGQMDIYDTILAMKDREPLHRRKKWLKYFLKWASEPTHVVMLENHDMPRATSRLGVDPDALAVLQFSTPSNSACIYRGQELGTLNPRLPSSIKMFKDVESRQRYESLLQKGMRPGTADEIVRHFSRENARWPVDWQKYRAQVKQHNSTLKTYQRMIMLWRNHPSLANPEGDVRVRDIDFEEKGMVAWYKVGSLQVKVDFSGQHGSWVKENGKTLVQTRP